MDKLNFNINEFLRFLLAGGWGLACYFFLNPERFTKMFEGSSVDLILIALVIGSIIYVVYRAILYPTLYKLVCFILWIFRKMKWDRGFIIPFFPSQTEINQDFRRWAQRKSENSFGKNLIEWGSQVHFLYCSSFASWVTILVSRVLDGYVRERVYYVWILFGILFFAGLVHHLRLVLYDLKTVEKEKVFFDLNN